MELGELKSKLLELLEVDVEFRYAVAGRLGILEVLKRLDRIEASLDKLWDSVNKLWEEVKGLREEQVRLWENQNKLWEEVKALREGQNKLWDSVNKLWENQNKLWEEVKVLREGQNKLWDSVNRLWEEVKGLREEQVRLWENQNKLWEEVKGLREEQLRFSRELLKLRVSFESMGRALGVTFEHYAASFVKLMLEDAGFPVVEVGGRTLIYQGEAYQVNIFYDDPLTVGEVTLYIGDVDEAKRELEKLLKRVEIAEKVTGRKAKLKILAIGNAPEQVIKYLKEQAEKHEVRLVYGRSLTT
ncbi:MAG: hypothetical protein QXH61_05595 [Candidatus Nezhaarchaeales archaeon]